MIYLGLWVKTPENVAENVAHLSPFICRFIDADVERKKKNTFIISIKINLAFLILDN